MDSFKGNAAEGKGDTENELEEARQDLIDGGYDRASAFKDNL